MSKIVNKETLTYDFFSMKSGDIKDMELLIKKLGTYLSKNEPDSELECILIASKATRESTLTNDFNKCCQIAAPMHEALQSKSNLSIIELTAWAMVTSLAPYKQSKDCAEKILTALENEHSQYKKRRTVEFIVYSHMQERLVRVKCSSDNDIEPEAEKGILKLFKHYTALVYDICEKHNLITIKAVTQLREGIFFRDIDLINEGLELIKKAKNKSLFSSFRLELLEYVHHLGDNISKAPLDIILGHNIATKRKELGISQEEVANYLEMQTNSYATIERGIRGATVTNLHKLAQYFDIPETYFFHAHKKDFALGNREKSDITLQKLGTILHNASDKTKNYAVSMVDSYVKHHAE